MKDKFISALHSKNKLKVIFHSKEDDRYINRTCAPLDFGPLKRSRDRSDRYHFWDYDSDASSHTLSVLPEHVISLEILGEQFEPHEFIDWKPQWKVSRDWGVYS
jgi:hypothetical protein